MLQSCYEGSTEFRPDIVPGVFSSRSNPFFHFYLPVCLMMAITALLSVIHPLLLCAQYLRSEPQMSRQTRPHFHIFHPHHMKIFRLLLLCVPSALAAAPAVEFPTVADP